MLQDNRLITFQQMNSPIPIELMTDSDVFFFKPRIVLAGRPSYLVVNNKDELDYEIDPETFLLEVCHFTNSFRGKVD